MINILNRDNEMLALATQLQDEHTLINASRIQEQFGLIPNQKLQNAKVMQILVIFCWAKHLSTPCQ
jgi:hypothetical protein